MSIDYKAAGKRVKIARIKREITQETLANKVGISITHISNIETGNASMSLPTAVAIANALDISLDEIVCGSIVKNKHIHVKDVKDALEDCSDQETKVLAEILIAAKTAIREGKIL